MSSKKAEEKNNHEQEYRNPRNSRSSSMIAEPDLFPDTDLPESTDDSSEPYGYLYNEDPDAWRNSEQKGLTISDLRDQQLEASSWHGGFGNNSQGKENVESKDNSIEEENAGNKDNASTPKDSEKTKKLGSTSGPKA